MLRGILSIVILCTSIASWATPTEAQPDRNVELYNVDEGLGLKGFDPVGYFAGDVHEGDASLTAEYGGMVYQFASEMNREEFLSNPTKYEPTYGGHCAWARANGAYADIDPTLFTQNGDRMHFFISRRAKALFDRELELHEGNADISWKDVSGEEPRI